MSQRMLSSVTFLPPVPVLSAMPLWRMLSGKGVCEVRVVSQNEFKLGGRARLDPKREGY